MRILRVLTTVLLVPMVLAAQAAPAASGQETALAQLNSMLPPEVAQQVTDIVTEATSRGLPGLAIANRALEAIAKGRSGEEVRAAAETFARSLAESRGAFTQGGRVPDRSELEAGAIALNLGVDGQAISAVAKSADRTEPLAVAVAVLGALVNAGVPMGAARDAVIARMEAGADNTELVEMSGDAGRMIAAGMRPSEVGLALASQRSGRTLPAGPPANVPRNDGRPVTPPVQPPVQPPVPTP